jgi:hypothetical protein
MFLRFVGTKIRGSSLSVLINKIISISYIFIQNELVFIFVFTHSKSLSLIAKKLTVF